jgi:hypothetical protein
VDLLLERVDDRGAQAGPEHGHEGHEREPDHQRGGGRGRASGRADRVLAREAPCDAADPL